MKNILPLIAVGLFCFLLGLKTDILIRNITETNAIEKEQKRYAAINYDSIFQVGATYTICAPPIYENNPWQKKEVHEVVIVSKVSGYVRYSYPDGGAFFSRSNEDFYKMTEACN